MQKFQEFRADLLPAPHQGLIGDDIKILGPFGIEQGQVMVPGQTPDVAAPEQLQAFIGAGIVADQVAQVQDGVHPLLVDPGQHAAQGFPVAVDVSDNRDPHKRFPVFGVSGGGANVAAAPPGPIIFAQIT